MTNKSPTTAISSPPTSVNENSRICSIFLKIFSTQNERLFTSHGRVWQRLAVIASAVYCLHHDCAAPVTAVCLRLLGFSIEIDHLQRQARQQAVSCAGSGSVAASQSHSVFTKDFSEILSEAPKARTGVCLHARFFIH